MTVAVTVMIAAGGTGGHIFPGLAIAEELRLAGATVLWLGAGGMETTLVQKRQLPLYTVPYRAPRRWWHLLLLLPAVGRAWRVLLHTRPAAVLCMGGYAAVPAGLAAWLHRIPLIVHEQNAVIGKANRLLARFARCVLTGFPLHHATDKTRHIGNPVRADFAAAAATRSGVRRQLQHVLVLGGSQGAQALNTICPPALAQLAQDNKTLSIVHQCGKGNADAVTAAYAAVQQPASVHEFIDDVATAMATADIVICRAGAATLAELTAAGVGAVLVPYPYAAADHQRINAEAMQAAGAAIVCHQRDLTATQLATQLATADVAALAQAAVAAALPQAAAQAAQVCMQEANHAA